jgi:hypothetical protein
MRTIKYKTHWSYAGKGIKHEAVLTDFLLDVLYLMEDTGVIPPLVVLNQVLQGGGNAGGMGPGTNWKPFAITEQEYDELVAALLELDVAEVKQAHPYVAFERVSIDHELNACTEYLDWLQQVSRKYRTP